MILASETFSSARYKEFFWILTSLTMLACEKGATCAELGEYVLTVLPEALEVSADNDYKLEATFYPVPARRMKFSDDMLRHISVWSDWYGWDNGENNPEGLPESKIRILEISAETPLRFNIQF